MQLQNTSDHMVKEDLFIAAKNCHAEGDVRSAEKYYKQVLKLDPGDTSAIYFLAVLLHENGRNTRALSLLRKGFNTAGDQIQLFNLFSTILNAIGNWDEAERAARKALKIDPTNSEIWLNLARSLAYKKEFKEAQESYIRHTQLSPNSSTGFCELASVFNASSNFASAVKAAESATRLNPGSAKAYNSLGVAEFSLGNLENARRSFFTAHKINQDDHQISTNLSSVYYAQGFHVKAIKILEDIVKKDPENKFVILTLGIYFSEIGEKKKSLYHFKKLLELDEDNIDGYYGLASSGTICLSEKQIERMIKLAENSLILPKERMKLNFGVGYQLDLRKNYDQAFSFFKKANELVREDSPEPLHKYDCLKQEELFKQIKSNFTKEFFRDRKDYGLVTDRLIFIVGMPRSGTSLIEKIVSSHRNVFGAGERVEISKAVNNLAINYGKKNQYVECAGLLDKGAIREAGEFYLEALIRTTSSQFICDKMPLNFIHLGFIHLMFPNAKVIHCKRDFRDIALSCYLQNFSHPYPWSYNFSDIQHYLSVYSDLMNHWKKVLPIDIIEIGYEDLIGDFENNVRILLDSLNLRWDNSCLEFYKSEGVVQTASKWQVREPINTGSVSRWKKYKKHLPSELISLNFK